MLFCRIEQRWFGIICHSIELYLCGLTKLNQPFIGCCFLHHFIVAKLATSSVRVNSFTGKHISKAIMHFPVVYKKQERSRKRNQTTTGPVILCIYTIYSVYTIRHVCTLLIKKKSNMLRYVWLKTTAQVRYNNPSSNCFLISLYVLSYD